jgi:hypothetical protein
VTEIYTGEERKMETEYLLPKMPMVNIIINEVLPVSNHYCQSKEVLPDWLPAAFLYGTFFFGTYASH